MDPIGIAGGVNLYGFAGGDPVNFSDPFGLCKGIYKTRAPCELFLAAFSEVSPRFAQAEARFLAHAILNRAKAANSNYNYRNTGNLDADIAGQIGAPNQVQGRGNKQWQLLAALLGGDPASFDPGSTEKLRGAILGVEEAYNETDDPTGGATFWDHPGSRPGQGAQCATTETKGTGSMRTAKCKQP